MILSALVLTACGGGSNEDLSDSKYVGTWIASTVALGDDAGDLDGEYLLVINGDGTGVFSGEDSTEEFTWSPTSDGFKTKGDLKLTFKDDGDNIAVKFLGVSLIFEKQF